MGIQIWVNVSGNYLLPNGTKPLPESLENQTFENTTAQKKCHSITGPAAYTPYRIVDYIYHCPFMLTQHSLLDARLRVIQMHQQAFVDGLQMSPIETHFIVFREAVKIGQECLSDGHTDVVAAVI